MTLPRIHLYLFILYHAFFMQKGDCNTLRASIYWNITTNPVVFGETVEITCHVSGLNPCSFNVSRRWTLASLEGKQDDDLVMLNGVAGEKFEKTIKYNEKLHENCKAFSLVISKFDEKDVNRKYTCSIGISDDKKGLVYREFANILKLEGVDYEYFPNEDSIHTMHRRGNKKGEFAVIIPKVYPYPSCAVYAVGIENYKLNMQFNGKYGLTFAITVSAQYKDIPGKEVCMRSIVFKCQIGSRSKEFTIVACPECHYYTRDKITDDVSYDETLAGTLITIAVTIYGLICCIFWILHLKKKSSLERLRKCQTYTLVAACIIVVVIWIFLMSLSKQRAIDFKKKEHIERDLKTMAILTWTASILQFLCLSMHGLIYVRLDHVKCKSFLLVFLGVPFFIGILIALLSLVTTCGIWIFRIIKTINYRSGSDISSYAYAVQAVLLFCNIFGIVLLSINLSTDRQRNGKQIIELISEWIYSCLFRKVHNNVGDYTEPKLQKDTTDSMNDDPVGSQTITEETRLKSST